MKDRIIILLCTIFCTTTAYGQYRDNPYSEEFARVESDDEATVISVFHQPGKNGREFFFCLSLKSLSERVSQASSVPEKRLFIPLGTSIKDVVKILGPIQGLINQPKGKAVEVEGCLSPESPNENRFPIRVTCQRRFMAKSIDFEFKQDGYLRHVKVYKSNFSELMSVVRWHESIGYPKNN